MVAGLEGVSTVRFMRSGDGLILSVEITVVEIFN